jgi:hypothetical protein
MGLEPVNARRRWECIARSVELLRRLPEDSEQHFDYRPWVVESLISLVRFLQAP